MNQKIIFPLLVLIIFFSLGLPQTFADEDTENNFRENDFRELPSDEKEYTEPMNILGKVIRIFDDKICVNEYCKEADILHVYLDGNVGMNTKNPIKLQITYCVTENFLYCENYLTSEQREIATENNGGGDFHAKWIITRNTQEGLYKIEGMVDGQTIGKVGNTMMDVINGLTSEKIIVVNNIKGSDKSITSITSENATIKILEINHERLSGTISYEICAKKYLKNPTFEIYSDSATVNILNEIELTEGQCHTGKYTIKAISSATIIIPLATSDKAVSMDELKEKIATLEEENSQLQSKINEIVLKMDNLQNIINEQIKVMMELFQEIKSK